MKLLVGMINGLPKILTRRQKRLQALNFFLFIFNLVLTHKFFCGKTMIEMGKKVILRPNSTVHCNSSISKKKAFNPNLRQFFGLDFR